MSSRNPLPGAGPCLVLAGVCLAACGAGSEGLVDETSYIVVGVEPRAAIDEAAHALAEHGLTLEHRVDADRFSAASFVDRASGRSSLRVVTRRGTVLALDAQAEEGALVALDPRTGEDLTADGHADLVVRRTEPERECLALAEIDDTGELRAVPTELRWLDPRLCLNALVEVDHDHRVDALVRLPLRELGEPSPIVTVPLLFDDRSVFAHAPWPDGHARTEIARREAALEVALDRASPDTAVGLAIELAVIIALRGGTDADIDARLDAVRGASLSTEAAQRLVDARRTAIALRELARPPEPPPPDTGEAPR